MTKVSHIVVLSSLCLSSIAFADGNEMKPHGPLKGHPNLIKAEESLHAAARSITKSQEANECVFGDEGGHGAKAKRAIADAERQVWEAAEWVNTHAKVCEAPRPKKDGDKSEPTLKGHADLKGHPNMVQAERELIAAYEAIVRSQEANECVFGVEGGHGQKAKAAILSAFKQVTEAADWVNTHENVCRERNKSGR